LGAPVMLAWGIPNRSAATGALILAPAMLISITVRPFSSYVRLVAIFTLSKVFQSERTRSYVTSPWMLS
jgi:hypothetical protein